MSFILDALKKSESERQRQNAPGIADLPQAAARQSSRGWLWIVGVLLTINLVVLFGLMLRPGQRADAPSVTSAAAPADVTKETDAGVETLNDLPVVVPQVSGAPQQSEDRAPTGLPAQSEVIAESAPQTGSAVVARATIADGPQTLNELRARGVLQLGELHLDIHVYSTVPADRFVFINMSKYKETAALAEGPVVREITPDGVILEHQGTEFLLPRE